jgi:uncharacterized protein YpmB
MIIVAILIAIIVAIALTLVSINNKHRKKAAFELVARFNELGEKNKLSFSQKEMLENLILGLDELRKKLLVLSRSENKFDLQVINLREIKHCSRKKLYKTINMGTVKKQQHETHIDKIVLEFDFEDKRAPVQVPFYEAGRSHLLEISDLGRKAESWEKIITRSINNGSKLPADKRQ